MRLIATVVLLVLLVSVAAAGDLELGTKKIEVSGLVGSLGLAGGLFWPVLGVTDYGLQLGPMAAIGEKTAVGGAGLKTDVSIDAPILENLNFAWAGYGYNWVDREWGWEGGFGVVVEIQ